MVPVSWSKLLAQKILSRGQLDDAHGVLREVSELVLVDMTAAQDEPWLADIRVSQVVGDVADRSVLARALTPATGSIFIWRPWSAVRPRRISISACGSTSTPRERCLSSPAHRPRHPNLCSPARSPCSAANRPPCCRMISA